VYVFGHPRHTQEIEEPTVQLEVLAQRMRHGQVISLRNPPYPALVLAQRRGSPSRSRAPRPRLLVGTDVDAISSGDSMSGCRTRRVEVGQTMPPRVRDQSFRRFRNTEKATNQPIWPTRPPNSPSGFWSGRYPSTQSGRFRSDGPWRNAFPLWSAVMANNRGAFVSKMGPSALRDRWPSCRLS